MRSALQYELGALVCAGVYVVPWRMRHRECERRFGDVLDGVAEIECVARRRLAALLRADVTHDDARHAVLGESCLQVGAGKRAMVRLVERRPA